MARRRLLDPSFWDDPIVARMDDHKRIFVIGCISLADDDGRLLADPIHLKSTLFKYQNISVKRLKMVQKDVCSQLKGFKLYSVGGIDYIQLTHWKRYQLIRTDLYKPSLLPSLRKRNGSVTEKEQKYPHSVPLIEVNRSKGNINNIVANQDLLKLFPQSLKERLEVYIQNAASKNKTKTITEGRKFTLLTELWNLMERTKNPKLFDFALETANRYGVANIGYVGAVIKNKITEVKE